MCIDDKPIYSVYSEQNKNIEKKNQQKSDAIHLGW